jgi:hypothetical protein
LTLGALQEPANNFMVLSMSEGWCIE